jgi:hypothetical protein
MWNIFGEFMTVCPLFVAFRKFQKNLINFKKFSYELSLHPPRYENQCATQELQMQVKSFKDKIQI